MVGLRDGAYIWQYFTGEAVPLQCFCHKSTAVARLLPATRVASRAGEERVWLPARRAGDNDNQMFRKIKAGQYKFLAPYWDPISAVRRRGGASLHTWTVYTAEY